VESRSVVAMISYEFKRVLVLTYILLVLTVGIVTGLVFFLPTLSYSWKFAKWLDRYTDKVLEKYEVTTA